MKEVTGIVELQWTVRLPDDHQYNNKNEGLCDDPAVESILKFVSQMGRVQLREDSDPVEVYTEMHEEDFVIEEDYRDAKDKYFGALKSVNRS